MSTETNGPKLAGKALITGASGFIGGRLRDQLLTDGLDVVAVRRRGSPPANKGRSVEAEYGDLEGLERVLREERPDYLFHVAGATKGVTYDDFRRANVTPTVNLLAAVRKAHPDLRRFVFVSSLTSYGPSTIERPLVESDPRNPIEYYGRSKREAEETLETAKDVPWTILRPGGVYGPGDVDYYELYKSISRGQNLFFGNRQRWFSSIYVDDFLDAARTVAEHPNAVHRGFFVCDNAPTTWERYQKSIVEAAGRKVLELDLPEQLTHVAAFFGELATKLDKKPRLFNRQKVKMGAQPAWTCKSDSLRQATGWTHRLNLEEGVRRTLDWYRAERWV